MRVVGVWLLRIDVSDAERPKRERDDGPRGPAETTRETGIGDRGGQIALLQPEMHKARQVRGQVPARDQSNGVSNDLSQLRPALVSTTPDIHQPGPPRPSQTESFQSLVSGGLSESQRCRDVHRGVRRPSLLAGDGVENRWTIWIEWISSGESSDECIDSWQGA